MPLVEKLLEVSNIKLEQIDRVLLKKIASAFFATSQYRSLRVRYRDKILLEKIVEMLAVSKNERLSSECIAQHTYFGNIEDINLIEVKKVAPDKSDIRLELISKKGNAKKVTLHTELIQKIWKVSDMKLK